MSPRETVTVSIIGFNSLVREGISRTLSSSEFEDCYFYATADEKCAAPASPGLAVAIVDFKTTEDTFRDLLILQQECPSVRVALMVDDFDFKQMVLAFQKGASAYLLKEIGADSLIDSLRLVIRGEKVIPSALLQHLPDTQMMSDSKPEVQVHLSDLLSEREVDTMRCLVMGYPNKVIAYRLAISEATVKVHVKAILRKLSVQNRTQAAIWAVNQGLVLQSEDFRDYAETLPSKFASYAVMNEYNLAPPKLSLASSF